MFRKVLRAFILALFIAFLVPFTVFAHGTTQVGDYELVIGFHNEPAYQGEPNGLDLFVTNTTTNERVNGLEETLRVEIIYGASKKELTIETQFGQDGAYTAHVLPTEAGDYTWHIWGEIEGTPVDVSMTSSPDTFSSVEPKSVVAFPAAEPTLAELRQQSQTALTIGIVGAVLGLIGIVVGFLGMRSRRS
jgi:hypothetical protein